MHYLHQNLRVEHLLQSWLPLLEEIRGRLGTYLTLPATLGMDPLQMPHSNLIASGTVPHGRACVLYTIIAWNDYIGEDVIYL